MTDDVRAGTYARLLQRYVDQGTIKPGDSTLVQFAGGYDERVCAAVGLTNCTFYNIAAVAATARTALPKGAARCDAHRMPHSDGAFDHVLAHNGLHHCSRPHEALHEMYRLARKTVLFVENQDSLLMRTAGVAGVVEWYELPAVVASGFQAGGVDDTGVPNHVYRWTKREVEKAVASFDPAVAVPIEFYAEWSLGSGRSASQALAAKLRLRPGQVTPLLTVAHRGLNALVPGQGNIFAAMIRKDLAVLQPWMESPVSMRREPDRRGGSSYRSRRGTRTMPRRPSAMRRTYASRRVE